MTANYLTGDCAEPPQTTENLKDVVPRGAAICATVQAVGFLASRKEVWSALIVCPAGTGSSRCTCPKHTDHNLHIQHQTEPF